MKSVAQWLAGLGLGEYAANFAQHAIEPDQLAGLDDDDLKAIGVAALGHRKRMLAEIARHGGADALILGEIAQLRSA